MTTQKTKTNKSVYVKVAGITDSCFGLFRGVNGTHAVIQSDTQPSINDVPMCIYAPGDEDHIKLKSGDFLWILLLSGDGDGEGMANFTNYSENVTEGNSNEETQILFQNVLDSNWNYQYQSTFDYAEIDEEGFLHIVGVMNRDLDEPFSEDWGTLAVCTAHDGPMYNYCKGGNPVLSCNGVATGFSGIDFNGGYRPVFGKAWRWINAKDLKDLGFVEGQAVNLELENGANSPRQSFTGWSDIYKNAGGIPTVVLTFDDCYSSPHNFLEYYKQNGIRGTLFIPWDKLNTGANYLSDQQVQDFVDIGWDIQLDGTAGDGRMILKADPAECVAELEEGRQLLASKGWNPNARHICYPEGVYGNYPDRVYATGVTGAIGSNVLVVDLADAAEIQVGWNVGSRNLPKVTLVTAVDTQTGEITINQTINDFGRRGESIPTLVPNVLFEDATDPHYYWNIPKALQAAGWKLGRGTDFGEMYTKQGFGDLGIIAPSKGLGYTPEERVMQTVEELKKDGTTCIFYTHRTDVYQNSSLHITPESFTAVLDYLVAERDAGNIELLTMDELYLRDRAEGE